MCKHHWMLDDPKGGEVPARCRECGVERIFKPGYVETFWNYPTSMTYIRRAKPEVVLLGDEVLR